MKPVLAMVLMTFALGFSTAGAFYAVGGQLALRGPYVLAREWPSIYALVVAFAAIIGVVLGSLLGSWSPRWIAIVVFGGWIGEYVVLASGLLANELTFLNAWLYWLLATAGPAQPIAAGLGWALGRRLGRPGVGGLRRSGG